MNIEALSTEEKLQLAEKLKGYRWSGLRYFSLHKKVMQHSCKLHAFVVAKQSKGL